MWKYFLFALIGWRCGHTPDDRVDRGTCRPFFQYDAVEYYSIEFSDVDLSVLEEKEKKTRKEERLLDVLIEEYSDSLIDSKHLKGLQGLGFTKHELGAGQIDALRSIFCERVYDEFETTSCSAVWRDILLFKKQGELTGTAKICFECDQSSFNGTPRFTGQFGGSGEFNLLRRVLSQSM